MDGAHVGGVDRGGAWKNNARAARLLLLLSVLASCHAVLPFSGRTRSDATVSGDTSAAHDNQSILDQFPQEIGPVADTAAADAGPPCWGETARRLAPVLWLTLDETDKAKPLINEVDGVEIGSYDPNVEPGQPPAIASGHAMGFPGNSTKSGVYVPNVPSTFPSARFTVALWIKASLTMHESSTFFSYAAEDDRGNDLCLDAERSRNGRIVVPWIAGGWYPSPSVTMREDTWHHLAATWDSTTGTLSWYVDGGRDQSASNVAKGYVLRNTGSLYLGQDQDAVRDLGSLDATQAFQGLLDEVMIWDRILTADEIAELYATHDRPCP